MAMAAPAGLAQVPEFFIAETPPPVAYNNGIPGAPKKTSSNGFRPKMTSAARRDLAFVLNKHPDARAAIEEMIVHALNDMQYSPDVTESIAVKNMSSEEMLSKYEDKCDEITAQGDGDVGCALSDDGTTSAAEDQDDHSIGGNAVGTSPANAILVDSAGEHEEDPIVVDDNDPNDAAEVPDSDPAEIIDNDENDAVEVIDNDPNDAVEVPDSDPAEIIDNDENDAVEVPNNDPSDDAVEVLNNDPSDDAVDDAVEAPNNGPSAGVDDSDNGASDDAVEASDAAELDDNVSSTVEGSRKRPVDTDESLDCAKKTRTIE